MTTHEDEADNEFTVHGAKEPETATDFALLALDQICSHLFFCQLNLDALHGEVDPNFDELVAAIGAAEGTARVALGAASLLHGRALLDESWGRLPSRPKAIFARHGAAVAQSGACRVAPALSSADKGARDLAQQCQKGGADIPSQPPRPCSASIRDGSRQCSKSALYLGAGQWAPNCYAHATTTARERHQQRKRDLTERDEAYRRRLSKLRAEIGRRFVYWWVNHECRPGRVEVSADRTGGDTECRDAT